MMFVTFSRLSSWKKGDLLIFNCIIVFLSFYRVLLWVLWETNCSKLGLSEGFPAQLCGFMGGWEGVSLYWFKVICLGVSN